MKVYHVETQQDYDALMIELEEKGCKWRRGENPTKLNEFKKYRKDICVYEEDSEITLSGIEYFKNNHNNETLIEYKTKNGEIKKWKI